MNMKSKRILSIFVLAGILCLTACSKTTDAGQTSESATQEEKEDESIVDQEESDQTEEVEDTQKSEGQPADITIYYSNDDATAFTTEEVQINSLSPEEVLNALIEKGAIAADVEILSFETTTVDGKSTILLDFNDAFASYISSMGSTGEYFVMGSICNTFLDAYDCEQIQVTVDGDTLSTGHAEYPGYMTTFS